MIIFTLYLFISTSTYSFNSGDESFSSYTWNGPLEYYVSKTSCEKAGVERIKEGSFNTDIFNQFKKVEKFRCDEIHLQP